MKKYLTLFLITTFSSFAFTQTISFKFLDYNNVNATLNDGGIFFNDSQSSISGYNVPNNSFLSTIYAMSFWYGGLDVNGQLKLSAQKYGTFEDQFEGPLTTDGSATADVSGAWTNSIFEVNRYEIDQHLTTYMNPGYSPTANMANWPGNGDTSNGFDNYLAPFVDVDSDGIYDPMAGDYPCIRGDHAVYVIMNDKADVHVSGGDPIGIEIHYMFYEYLSVDAINNTTFVHGKIINRGTQTLQDFKMSAFVDGDIGNYSDDFFGCDSTRNLMYFYNGDDFDETGTGVPHSYMQNPPACGIMSLTKDFESIGMVDGSAATSGDFWNMMNAQDISGAPWMNQSTMAPTKFMFASDPSSSTGLDSEAALGNPPGDRRGVATTNLWVLAPNDVRLFDYAVIYHRDTVGNLGNASGLLGVADFVQTFYNDTVLNECLGDITSLDEIPEVEFSISPNPSNGEFKISLVNDFSNAQLEILDISGRAVLDRINLKFKETNIVLNQPSGVYLLHLIIDGQKTIKRMILE